LEETEADYRSAVVFVNQPERGRGGERSGAGCAESRDPGILGQFLAFGLGI